MMEILKVEDFKKEIESGLILVDFFAEWCGPCKMVAPILEEINEEMSGKVKIIKVDVDKLGAIADEYEISNIPTMIIFKDGEKKETMIGFLPKESIKSKLESYL